MIVTGIWATIVTIINQVTHRNAEVPTTLVSVLGIVLGFSLSYRWGQVHRAHAVRLTILQSERGLQEIL